MGATVGADHATGSTARSSAAARRPAGPWRASPPWTSRYEPASERVTRTVVAPEVLSLACAPPVADGRGRDRAGPELPTANGRSSWSGARVADRVMAQVTLDRSAQSRQAADAGSDRGGAAAARRRRRGWPSRSGRSPRATSRARGRRWTTQSAQVSTSAEPRAERRLAPSCRRRTGRPARASARRTARPGRGGATPAAAPRTGRPPPSQAVGEVGVGVEQAEDEGRLAHRRPSATTRSARRAPARRRWSTATPGRRAGRAGDGRRPARPRGSPNGWSEWMVTAFSRAS